MSSLLLAAIIVLVALIQLEEIFDKKDKHTYIMHSVAEDEFDPLDVYLNNIDLTDGKNM